MILRAAICAGLLFIYVGSVQAEYVLSAPPRESEEKAKEIFEPIAAYLSKVTGEKVVYKWSDNWLTYQSEMQKDKFDFVFDGPHFVSWRMAQHQHTPLVRLPKPLHFLAVVKQKENTILTTKKAAGYKVCTPAPPNLAALTFMSEFDNPSRQPVLVDTHGYPQSFAGLLEGKCRVALMNSGVLSKVDKDNLKARVIYKSADMTNQGLTASARVPVAMRSALRNALTSVDGTIALKGLSAEYGGSTFVVAKNEDYAGYWLLLSDMWGYNITKPVAGDFRTQRVAARQ